MAQSKLIARAVPAFMLAVWTAFAATVEAQRVSSKPPLLGGHGPMQRVKVGAAAAGAVPGLMAALTYQPSNVMHLR